MSDEEGVEVKAPPEAPENVVNMIPKGGCETKLLSAD